MSENNECNRAGGYLAAFAIGALIGTGVALLYAPRSGKETRELIAKKGKALKGQATDALADAKHFIEDKKAELTAALDAGKEAMQDERSKHQKAA